MGLLVAQVPLNSFPVKISEITIREVIIYDLLGRKIKGINGVNITKISTESLRPGTYSIQLKTEEVILVKQIVIGR